jgi:hypothetical protein
MIDALYRVLSAPSLRDAWYSSPVAFILALIGVACVAVGVVGLLYRLT